MSNTLNHESQNLRANNSSVKTYFDQNSIQAMPVPKEQDTIEISFKIIAQNQYFCEYFPGRRPIFEGYIMIIEGKRGQNLKFIPDFGTNTERNLKFLGSLHPLHYVFGFHPHLYIIDSTKYVMVFLTPVDIPVTEEHCIAFFQSKFLPHFNILYPNIDKNLVPRLSPEPTDYISALSEVLENSHMFELVESFHFPARKQITVEAFVAQVKQGKYIVLYSFWAPGSINLEVLEKYQLSTDYLLSSDEYRIIAEVKRRYRFIAKDLKKFDIYLVHKIRGYDITLTLSPNNGEEQDSEENE